MKIRSAAKISGILLVLSVLVGGATDHPSASEEPGPGKLVVHEWGTFTSIAGEDGGSLEWRPLAGHSDLPNFVYSRTSTRPQQGAPGTGLRHSIFLKTSLRAKVRMETPVLYFYSDREQVVSVRVDFPQGTITEWYPWARHVGKDIDWRSLGLPPGTRLDRRRGQVTPTVETIDWGRIRIMPDAKVKFPKDKTESHYYPARETDAAPIRIGGSGNLSAADALTLATRAGARLAGTPKNYQYEKFLFYRGVGNFTLPLSVRLAGDRVILKNRGRDPIPAVILFENRDGKVGYHLVETLRHQVAVQRPALDQTIDAVASELEAALIAQGLFEKEARAMLKTWRDSWFEEGLRVFYIVPRARTDTILPITIDPKPEKLVRVLVGRTEIITPRMERMIWNLAARLGDESAKGSEAAHKALQKYGRFAAPVIRRLLAQTMNPTVKARLEALIASPSKPNP